MNINILQEILDLKISTRILNEEAIDLMIKIKSRMKELEKNKEKNNDNKII